MKMDIEMVFIGVFFLAFACEYIDSTLGMGYGTTLTPVLLIMGYAPLEVVPVVLLSEFITGGLASFAHHKEGNVNFKDKKTLNVAFVFVICGMVGTLIAVFVSLQVPKLWLQIYIGVLVTGLGVLMLFKRKSKMAFSWKKIIGIGLLASFNKGVSGGGYGPLVCSGQILSGVPAKASVAITSASESLVCLIGVLAYVFIAQKEVNWHLAPCMILGAVLSVPFAVKTVGKINEKMFMGIVGVATLALGSFTLLKAFQVF